MNKKFFLSAFVFLLAIGGAFASSLLLPEMGYSRIQDVQVEDNEQTLDCKERIECDNEVGFVCTATFTEGAGTFLYVNVPLYKLGASPSDCSIQLTRSTP